MTTLIVILVSAAVGFALGFVVAKNNANKVAKVQEVANKFGNAVNELKK